jgi:hypothetical protein
MDAMMRQFEKESCDVVRLGSAGSCLLIVWETVSSPSRVRRKLDVLADAELRCEQRSGRPGQVEIRPDGLGDDALLLEVHIPPPLCEGGSRSRLAGKPAAS